MSERVLTARELNRTLLERQLLRRRHRLTVTRAVERVAGLQAQWANSPYVALWSRLEGFERAQLARALKRGTLVKATLMRMTLHIVTPRDYHAFHAVFRQDRIDRFTRELAKHAPDLDVAAAAKDALAAVGDRPALRREYFEAAGEDVRMPAGNVRAWMFWVALQMHGDLVHVPPSGMWGHSGSPAFAPARSWIRAAASADGDPRVHLVRRYLTAFGPASSADLQSWSQARNLRPALRELEPELRRFRDEAGRLLLDLRRAPLVDGDAAAPVRFLPKWDSSILGYAPPERWRILPERYRKRVIAVNGDVRQTFTVDGFIAGGWEVERRRGGAVLMLQPFARLSKGARSELDAEGEQLLRFIEPDAHSYAIRVMT
ncbi:MAG TPA: winged helix DNA-binding domain-containing protein [Gaiellaceae bacterium]|nr:winged helix DNA-binding domain-containing protein [Gaiellaceae bacterium]